MTHSSLMFISPLSCFANLELLQWFYACYSRSANFEKWPMLSSFVMCGIGLSNNCLNLFWLSDRLEILTKWFAAQTCFCAALFQHHYT